jgi:hypothetical protein
MKFRREILVELAIVYSLFAYPVFLLEVPHRIEHQIFIRVKSDPIHASNVEMQAPCRTFVSLPAPDA